MTRLQAIGLISAWLVGGAANAAPGLRDIAANGDIILHKSQSSQAAALRAATGSPYTHVGMLFQRLDAFQVLEAVEPVKWTALDAWIQRGEAGQVVVLRLRDSALLEDDGVLSLRQAGEAYLGRHYDPVFQWSDERIYCSELVYKAYQNALGVEVGERTTFSAFDLSSPAVQELIRVRTNGRMNADEPVVAPASLLTDPDLRVVYSTDSSFPVQEIAAP